ncbi:MAG: YeeE/YedE family protein [Gammaproteobacteria bacterium]|nr:MAG: YeeE/YedE family protein [Gammaproteobacteria bacterium]
MEITIIYQIFLIVFTLAFILGAVANKTDFCTMGAVSDWVNMGDTNRMRSWMLALTTALIIVLCMEYFGLVDMSLTTDNAKSNPPYRTTNFVWLRYIVGGFIFGIGMTMASGCGNKTLIRFGAGNLKSLFVLLAISAGASLMMFTNFSYDVFLSWMGILSIDFAEYGISGQHLSAIITGYSGAENSNIIHLTIGLLVASLFALFIFRSKEFLKHQELLIAGVVVGMIVAGAWFVSAGFMGQELLEEAEMMDEIPYAIGAQSFTFVAPTAHMTQFATQGFNLNFLTFGIIAALGVILGSFIYALIAGKLRFEWFVSLKDFANHIIGGFIMGIGGVLGMGCTIGQGITGASTLALGSFMTLFSIIFGSALTMKYQYYRMLYEDESMFAAIITAMVEMKMLPAKLRKLEKL